MKKLILPVLLAVASVALLAADVSGTWNAAVVLDVGSGTAVFTFQQTGEAFTGTYSGTLGEAKIAGTVKGDQVEWSFTSDQAGKVSYKGTLNGARIQGTTEYGALGKGTFTAEKK